MQKQLPTHKIVTDDNNEVPIIVRGTMQLYIPTERELFTLFLDKINTLHQTIQMNHQELYTQRHSNEEANEKPIEYSLKKFLTVKELENMYSISQSQQKGLRGRIKNPLPYYQEMENGKISYKVSEVEEWKNNQKVIRDI